VFERTKGKPAQADPWENPPNAPTRTVRITDMNVATSAQIGKIRGTLKDMGITSADEARDLVNACLAAKGMDKQVTLITELDKREASKVIEALLESVTVQQATAELS
jgi:hypothetical protein